MAPFHIKTIVCHAATIEEAVRKADRQFNELAASLDDDAELAALCAETLRKENLWYRILSVAWRGAAGSG